MDIGAHDGIRFSNSYAFSVLGWKGICVEAHPDYYKYVIITDIMIQQR